jgi:hypothetical protein
MWKSILVIVMLLLTANAGAAAAARSSGATKQKAASERSERPERSMEPRAVDWKEAFDFFAEHSPLRAKAFEEMSEKQREKLKPLILDRYATIMKPAGKADPDIRALKIQQLDIEDSIFGIKQTLDRPAAPAETVARLKGQLREKVKELVESRMNEREHRLSRLESLLKKEREQLTADQQHKDQLVENRYQEVLNAKNPDAASEHPRPFRPDGERGPGKAAARK